MGVLWFDPVEAVVDGKASRLLDLGDPPFAYSDEQRTW